MAVIDHKNEEMVFLAGDRPDPLDTLAPGATVERARVPGGMSVTTNLAATAKGHPLVRYKDFVLTLDVYQPDGGVPWIHLICPKCRQPLRIAADRKAFEYDPLRNADVGGRIDIEPFRCTGEGLEGRSQQFGLGVCHWQVGIYNNVARDA